MDNRIWLYGLWTRCTLTVRSAELLVLFCNIHTQNERNKLFLCKFSKLQYYHVLLKLVNIWVEWVIRKVKGWTFLRYSVHSPFTGSFKSNHWCCLQFPIIHDEHWQTTVNTKCSYQPQSTLYFYTVHTHSLPQFTVSQGQKDGPL